MSDPFAQSKKTPYMGKMDGAVELDVKICAKAKPLKSLPPILHNYTINFSKPKDYRFMKKLADRSMWVEEDYEVRPGKFKTIMVEKKVPRDPMGYRLVGN